VKKPEKMKYHLFIMTIFIVIACNSRTKEEITETSPTPNSLVDTPYTKMQISSFSEVVKNLQNDPDVTIADTCNSFPGRPFVICYMQRHLMDNNIEALNESDKIIVNEIQVEIRNSLKHFIKLPIYFEGFLIKDGRIDSKEKFNRLIDESLYSPLTYYLLENFKTINIYGVEDFKKVAQTNAIFSLRYTYRITRDQYFQITDRNQQIEALRIFRDKFDNFFQIDNRTNNPLFKDRLIYNAYDDEMNAMKTELNAIKKTYPDNPDGWFAMFLRTGKYIDERFLKVTRFDRNIPIVKVLPDTVSSVLVLGINHFKSGNSTVKGSFIEDILIQRKLNYIILKPQ
jgi:hypothetical protein